MAYKISLFPLKLFNVRSLNFTRFGYGYIGSSFRRRMCVNSATAGNPITRSEIVWKTPLNRGFSTKPVVDICVAQNHDQDRLLDFLRAHFYPEEPLTVGSEPKQQEKADEEFAMSNVKHGTCLMALYRNCDQESVVGAVIAGPKDCHESDRLLEEAATLDPKSKWGRIIKILALIERDSNVFESFGIELALHAHILGVDQCARGLGLGTLLMQDLKSLGEKLKFQLLTADCTSVYSAVICERLGMECVNILRYEDYCDEDGNQVFRPPPPHDAVRTYAMRLCS